MAKYQGSPFGSISGKVQGVVGAKWKGIDYIRNYVIPNNPNSDDQKLYRGRFAACVEIGKQINQLCLKPDWSPVPKKKSAFNDFISKNSKLLTTAPYELTDFKVHFGSLANVSLDSAVMAADGKFTLTFTPNKLGEASDSDDVGVLLYDDEQERYFYGTAKRNVGSIVVDTKQAKTMGDKYVYWYYTVNTERTAGSDSVVAAATYA